MSGPQTSSCPWRFPHPRVGKRRWWTAQCLTTARADPDWAKRVKRRRTACCTCLVGIEDHLAGGIEHEPRRRPEAQGAMLGLFQLAAQEPVAQPVVARLRSWCP